jgi:hypothetical protein
MQMDAEFQKEQNGTLFVWWGHWKGVLGEGGPLRGAHPKKYTCRPKQKYKKHPPGESMKIVCTIAGCRHEDD